MGLALHVTYAHPEAGSSFDQKTAAEYLQPGCTYTIRTMEVGHSRSHVTLYSFPRDIEFNTVMFDPCEYDDEGDPIMVTDGEIPGPGPTSERVTATYVIPQDVIDAQTAHDSPGAL